MGNNSREGRKTRRRFVKSGEVAGIAGVAGCGGVFEDPPVDRLESPIFDVRSPSVGATSATLRVVLQLHNAADRELPDLSGDLSVGITGERMASPKAHFGSLAAGEASKQPIKPVIEYARSGGALVDAIKRNRFRLEIDAKFQSGSASKNARITCKYTG